MKALLGLLLVPAFLSANECEPPIANDSRLAPELGIRIQNLPAGLKFRHSFSEIYVHADARSNDKLEMSFLSSFGANLRENPVSCQRSSGSFLAVVAKAALPESFEVSGGRILFETSRYFVIRAKTTNPKFEYRVMPRDQVPLTHLWGLSEEGNTSSDQVYFFKIDERTYVVPVEVSTDGGDFESKTSFWHYYSI